MGVGFWRRVAGALALFVGIGVAVPGEVASAAPSSAASTTGSISSTPLAGRSATEDWWWGP